MIQIKPDGRLAIELPTGRGLKVRIDEHRQLCQRSRDAWANMRTVRDIEFSRVEPVHMGEMTCGSSRSAPEAKSQPSWEVAG